MVHIAFQRAVFYYMFKPVLEISLEFSVFVGPQFFFSPPQILNVFTKRKWLKQKKVIWMDEI